MAVLKNTEKNKDPCIRQLIQVSQGLHEWTKKKKTLDNDKVEDITRNRIYSTAPAFPNTIVSSNFTTLFFKISSILELRLKDYSAGVTAGYGRVFITISLTIMQFFKNLNVVS